MSADKQQKSSNPADEKELNKKHTQGERHGNSDTRRSKRYRSKDHRQTRCRSAPQYEKAINELIAGGEIAFVVDFNGLDYISSAGLRGLLVTAKQLKGKGGQVRFANVKGTVKEVFNISGFGSIFQMDDSVAAALAKIA